MPSDRYRKQILLPQLGEAGQAKLRNACAMVVGVGALGCASADLLARAGIGRLILIDRDVVELSNLHRQVLFDEADAAAAAAKAAAAAERVGRVNADVAVTPVVADVTSDNLRQLLRTHRPDVILDGTDNVQTRYLLNDAAVEAAVPWVYGGCVAAAGRVMPILPGGACLRCVFPQPPAPADLPTCETAGVFGPAVAIVGAQQAALTLRIVTGQFTAADAALVNFDAWTGRFHRTPLAGALDPDCPACARRTFTFLDAPPASAALCGRNAVQLRLGTGVITDGAAGGDDVFDRVEARLSTGATHYARNPYFVRCEVDGLRLSIFADGRVLVHGTSDVARARTVAARYFG